MPTLECGRRPAMSIIPASCTNITLLLVYKIFSILILVYFKSIPFSFHLKVAVDLVNRNTGYQPSALRSHNLVTMHPDKVSTSAM